MDTLTKWIKNIWLKHYKVHFFVDATVTRLGLIWGKNHKQQRSKSTQTNNQMQSANA